MARRKARRQSHGSAWHWKQTDCWYYTRPGSKQRVALFDEKGERIRGTANKEAAEVALAREKLAWSGDANYPIGGGEWLVARVCSDYIQYCERGLAKDAISKGHRDSSVLYLNGLCSYCGALPVVQLKKAHVVEWMDQQTSWRSSETRRGVITIVLAAFNRATEMHGIANPLKGLKKPKPKPRLHSFQPEDEQQLYDATEPRFKDFLFAAIHTGLRPFCELAKITADHVEETERGMMWRVYSSKTKKTRKIPIRPEVAKLARVLMKTAPRGSNIPLFRNTKGKPWRQSAGVVRFLSLKERLGWRDDPMRGKFSCYTCRHTFVHRMLAGYWTDGQGCTIETVAELIGDTPKVAYEHYGKEWGQHYQAPLWAAIGEPTVVQSPARNKRCTHRNGKQKGSAKSRRPTSGRR